jgi:hypothetical protein
VRRKKRQKKEENLNREKEREKRVFELEKKWSLYELGGKKEEEKEKEKKKKKRQAFPSKFGEKIAKKIPSP